MSLFQSEKYFIQGILKQQNTDQFGRHEWVKKFYKFDIRIGCFEVSDSAAPVAEGGRGLKLSAIGAKYAKEWSISSPLAGYGFDVVWPSGNVWSFLAEDESQCELWVRSINRGVLLNASAAAHAKENRMSFSSPLAQSLSYNKSNVAPSLQMISPRPSSVSGSNQDAQERSASIKADLPPAMLALENSVHNHADRRSASAPRPGTSFDLRVSHEIDFRASTTTSTDRSLLHSKAAGNDESMVDSYQRGPMSSVSSIKPTLSANASLADLTDQGGNPYPSLSGFLSVNNMTRVASTPESRKEGPTSSTNTSQRPLSLRSSTDPSSHIKQNNAGLFTSKANAINLRPIPDGTQPQSSCSVLVNDEDDHSSDGLSTLLPKAVSRAQSQLTRAQSHRVEASTVRSSTDGGPRPLQDAVGRTPSKEISKPQSKTAAPPVTTSPPLDPAYRVRSPDIPGTSSTDFGYSSIETNPAFPGDPYREEEFSRILAVERQQHRSELSRMTDRWEAEVIAREKIEKQFKSAQDSLRLLTERLRETEAELQRARKTNEEDRDRWQREQAQLRSDAEDRVANAVAGRDELVQRLQQDAANRLEDVARNFERSLEAMEKSIEDRLRKEFDAETAQIVASLQWKCNQDVEEARAAGRRATDEAVEAVRQKFLDREKQTIEDLRRLEQLHNERVSRLEAEVEEARGGAQSADERVLAAREDGARNLAQLRQQTEDQVRQLQRHSEQAEMLRAQLQAVHQDVLAARTREASYKDQLSRVVEEFQVQRAALVESQRKASGDEAAIRQLRAAAQEFTAKQTALSAELSIAQDEIAMLEHELRRAQEDRWVVGRALNQAEGLVYGRGMANRTEAATESKASLNKTTDRELSLNEPRAAKPRIVPSVLGRNSSARDSFATTRSRSQRHSRR